MKRHLVMACLLTHQLHAADLVVPWQSQVIPVSMSTAAVMSPRLITGSQPSVNDLHMLKNAGVDVVIDLRGDAEDRGFDETVQTTHLGLQYLRLPISGADAVTLDNARALSSLLETVKDKNVLLHCASSNRVGALLALREHLQGQSVDASLEFGRKAGLKSLEPVVKAQMSH